MRRFAGTSTTALLQKASAQLSDSKGGSKASATVAVVDDDGLADYLQTLNKKPAKHDMQWDKFGDLSDISADETNSAKMPQKRTEPMSTSGSKFIKKKTESQSVPAGQKPTQTPSKTYTAGDTAIQSSQRNIHARSSALGKAQSFAAKYKASRGAAGKITTLSSDSDMELNLSPDEEVLANVQVMKHTTRTGHIAVDSGSNMTQPLVQSKSESMSTGNIKPSSLHSVNKQTTDGKTSASSPIHSTHPQSSLFHSTVIHTISDDEDSRSSSVGIGKGGSKFLKQRVQSLTEIPDVQDSKLATAAEKPLRKSISTKQSTAKEHTVPVSVSAGTLGHTVVSALDSDDESLAEFIGRLSSDKQPHASSSADQKQLTSSSHSLIVMSDDDISTSSHVDDSVSEAESDNFHLNVHGVDALDNNVDKSVAADNDVSLAHLGVHTIDELLDSGGGHGVDTDLRLQYESDYESDVHSSSPTAAAAPALRSILSITPRSLTPKSTRSRVRLMDGVTEVRSRSLSSISTARSRSASSVSTARSPPMTPVPDEEILTGRSAASVQTVASDSDSRSAAGSELVSTASTSEVTARPISHSETEHQPCGRRRRSSEPTTVSIGQKSQRQGSQRLSETAMMIYSEDFTSAKTSVDYSELISSVSDEVERQQRRKKHSSPTRTSHRSKSKSIQTGLDVGLQYWWPHGSPEAVTSSQFRLAFVDPASVAATVVSADTLEAVTSYSPSMLAMNDFLRQQLELSRQFVAGQRRLHHDLVLSLQSTAESYHYTTLSNTKDFIRKHRRPVTTFDEALREIKQQMDLA